MPFASKVNRNTKAVCMWACLHSDLNVISDDGLRVMIIFSINQSVVVCKMSGGDGER